MENVEKNLARIDEEIKQYEKKLFVQKTSFEKVNITILYTHYIKIITWHIHRVKQVSTFQLLLKNEKNPRRRTPISNNFPVSIDDQIKFLKQKLRKIKLTQLL